eukprot:TRINITY_DN29604_c0_g1_i1.p1 TRINITY_DN29604_c0_g1~~TRINITY_DN29604_c0_g1_i1.p1  ORF type:complete len:817 (-),score=155.92 TRINITY_DN29604_c0_g1_i1:242-2692(-)
MEPIAGLEPVARVKATSVAALFGDDSDSQPLWFKKDAFVEDDFDSEAYISELRRFVPLETLRGELRSHLQGLKSELVELINRDYTDFVNLSTKLVDVDGAVLRMRMPLMELRTKLLLVREGVATSLAQLQEGLQRRADASAARHMLELLLDTSHVLSKVEELLLELQRMAPGNVRKALDATSPSTSLPLLPTALSERSFEAVAATNGDAPSATPPTPGAAPGISAEEARSQLLERIASEMNRLHFCVARAQTLPFVQSIDKRIRAADATLLQQLRLCLERGLERKDRTVLYHCLRAYAALDDTSGAEEVFRESVVAPRVAALLTATPGAPAGAAPTSALGGRGGAAGTAAGTAAGGDPHLLAPVFEALQRHVEEDCKFLLGIANATHSGLHAFDFLSNSILREVHSALQRTRSAAFSPGRPHEFLANYRASINFLVFLEGFCPTQAAVLHFRQQTPYSDFLHQWNLGVSFNLQFLEIAGELETALTQPGGAMALATPAPRDSVDPPLMLNVSKVLWERLLCCWHPDVYVTAVADKFLRLTLQMVARYLVWLDAGLTARKAVSAGGATAVSNAQASGGEWALSATPEDLLLVRHDLELLASAMKGEQLAGRLGGLLGPAVPVEVIRAAERSVGQAADGLLQRTHAISDVVTEAIARKCIEVLGQLKGITATYRMTNKPLPVRHSHYVVGVLQPLRAFMEGKRASQLSESARKELVSRAVERVTARYDEMARELVTMARKTEESLERMRQKRAPRGAVSDTGGGAPHISDTDKITAQLFLDVQEYARQVAKFDVQAASIAGYVSLWQCVAPEGRQIGV